MRIRRLGATAGPLAVAASLSLAFSTPASAAELLYQNSNARVMASGGEAVALNACISDAHDGIIQTQQVACNQMATSNNWIDLDSVRVLVTPNTPPYKILYKNTNDVSVKVTGGLTVAINACIADAHDGIIQTQQVACNQYASAGNVVTLNKVTVEVFQP